MSVRVAVIGTGVMGADHARILAEEVPGATLQVVCDAAPDRARTIADRYGAADIAEDAAAVVARSDVDAVLVASPDHTHAPLCHAAIKAGTPILCEKPLAPGSAEALSVVEAEAAAGVQRVFCGFMRRFDPPYEAMKASLDAGQIGRAIMFHNFHRNVVAPPHFDAAMAVTNSAPHEFDIVRFVLGAEPTAISTFQPGNVDPNAPGAPVVMVLETDAGQLVTIEVNVNATYGYDVRAELVGERGSLDLLHPATVRLNLDLRSGEAFPADWRPRFAESYRRQDMAFVEFARTGAMPAAAATAWDGYVATVVAEAGVAALHAGTKAPITLAEKPALYR